MRALAACACFVLSAACLALMPWVHRAELQRFASTEPRYSYPVPLRGGIAVIRRDSEGKGHFGASRGADGKRKHEGIDLLAPVRFPVYAAKSGRVLVAGQGRWSKGYGLYLELQHPDGQITRYAHLSAACVQAGDWVRRAQVIGVAGKTGNAAGRRVHPHVHFEIREQGAALDPGPRMDPRVPLR
jgi:murein DD-endopeptidase MepM/ murein hydrolase activator NlpD